MEKLIMSPKMKAKMKELEAQGIEIKECNPTNTISQKQIDEEQQAARAEKIRMYLEDIPGRTINDYIATTPKQKKAKQMAVEYAVSHKGSIGFFGKPGTGKSHLAIAIERKLLNDNIEVPYIQYNKMIRELVASRFNDENYSRLVHKYTKPRLIMLDDFLKGSVRAYSYGEKLDDVVSGILFEIIDKRYAEGKHMIITSEYPIKKMRELDAAIGGRIKQYCGDQVIEFDENDPDYRMK